MLRAVRPIELSRRCRDPATSTDRKRDPGSGRCRVRPHRPGGDGAAEVRHLSADTQRARRPRGAYQEALDLVMYLKQCIMERG